MKLDNLDFLFLDYVSEYPPHLSRISASNANEIFNKPHHFLNKKQVLDKVEFLHNLGLVRHDENGHVYLTKKGGTIWEQKFSPKWECYVDCSVYFKVDCDLGLFRSISYRKMEYILKSGVCFGRFNKIKRIENWAPYYWKDKVPAYELITVLLLRQ